MFILLQPIADAVKSHGRKTAVGTKLRSRELEALPRELRNAAQMSAGVESIRVLQNIQDKVGEILAHTKNSLGGQMDRGAFIRDVMKTAEDEGLTPADPAKRGTIEDVTSEKRLELIYEMQTGMAYGYANWKAGLDPEGLEAFPAQELVRIKEAKVPRNWAVRWAAAGQEVGWVGAAKQPHIALKTSPIWRKLSRFDNPWPPYDYNSGMWVEDIGLEDALKLGLVKPGDKIQPPAESFTDNLSGSVKGVSPELRQQLINDFGDQIEIVGDEARFVKDEQASTTEDTEDTEKDKERELAPEPAAAPKEFSDYKPAVAWADHAINPSKTDYTNDERAALVKAQGSTAVENAKLWKGQTLSKSEQEWHEKMIQAFKKAPELPAITVHHYGKTQDLGGVEIGEAIPWKGFLSTSMAPGGYVQKKYQKGVHVKISVPKGAKGIYMDRLNDSTNKQEAEIMFPPGMKLVVKKKEMVDGVWEIEAELL